MNTSRRTCNGMKQTITGIFAVLLSASALTAGADLEKGVNVGGMMPDAYNPGTGEHLGTGGSGP